MTTNKLTQLKEAIDLIQAVLEQIPNTSAQKSLQTAQKTYQESLTKAAQSDSTRAEHQNIQAQINQTLKQLDKTQNDLSSQYRKETKQKAQKLIEPVANLILKLNEMYQQRPTISLLTDLIQNAEVQKEIMERSITQFDKPLSFEQIEKVNQIVQNASKKIHKAYDYAEELYSGRQTAPTSNSIKKVSP